MTRFYRHLTIFAALVAATFLGYLFPDLSPHASVIALGANWFWLIEDV